MRERWLKSYQIHVYVKEDSEPIQSDVHNEDMPLSATHLPQLNEFHFSPSKIPKKPLKSTLSQNQKYKNTLQMAQKIASIASQVGMHIHSGKCS